jgi:predicted GIY-YIG superfamily endonuclease
MSGKTNVLYRFYSNGGQLLYVGITVNPPARWRTHREDKDWWAEVVGITVETYGGQEELAAAERRAIQVEHPLYNVVYNKRAKIVSAPTKHPSNKLAYYCDSCGHVVTKGTGYIHVSYNEMNAVSDAWQKLKLKKVADGEVFAGDYEELMAPGISPQAAERLKSGAASAIIGAFIYSGAELLALPDAARWAVHHRDCDPVPDSVDYHFDVGRADTYEKLLSWTAHLLEKDWLTDTNWSEFLYSKLSREAKDA